MSNDSSKKPPQPTPPRGKDDGPLDSIGKAITDPVKTGAEEEEEERDDGVVREQRR